MRSLSRWRILVDRTSGSPSSRLRGLRAAAADFLERDDAGAAYSDDEAASEVVGGTMSIASVSRRRSWSQRAHERVSVLELSLGQPE